MRFQTEIPGLPSGDMFTHNSEMSYTACKAIYECQQNNKHLYCKSPETVTVDRHLTLALIPPDKLKDVYYIIYIYIYQRCLKGQYKCDIIITIAEQ